jgi:AcrR family transcriptional regulator
MPNRDVIRENILRATAALLAERGRDAVTTRSVSAAAGVQPPTIYRLFGDMRGLLDAVTAAGFADYLARKTAQEPSGDALDDLRAGWDLHVAFGLENPAIYLLMYGEPDPGSTARATADAHEILLGLVRKVAAAGRLTVTVERAADMIHSAGMGVVLTLLSSRPENRDLALSAQMREAVLSAVTVAAGDRPCDGAGRDVARRALALQAALPDVEGSLTPGERALLEELLGRLADSSVPAAS